MKTYTYSELPERIKLHEFAFQLDWHLNLLPAEYEFKKRAEAEKMAKASCDAGIYMECAGSYFRCELKEIQ